MNMFIKEKSFIVLIATESCFLKCSGKIYKYEDIMKNKWHIFVETAVVSLSYK